MVKKANEHGDSREPSKSLSHERGFVRRRNSLWYKNLNLDGRASLKTSRYQLSFCRWIGINSNHLIKLESELTRFYLASTFGKMIVVCEYYI